MDKKERIKWIECAKCFGILLVIISHTVKNGIGSAVRGLIFSFHMPLFFVLSCITYSCSINEDMFKKKVCKASKHLLVPAIAIFAIDCVQKIYKNQELIAKISFWKGNIYKLLFASGVKLDFAGMDVEALGIPWFFFSLLVGRSLFDYLHLKFSEKYLSAICWGCSLIGIILGNVQWLPFSIDISLAIMPFFLMGYKMKEYKINENPMKKIGIISVLWMFTFILQVPDFSNAWTYMELATRRYPIYPICFVTAFLGVLIVCKLSCFFEKVGGRIVNPIAFLGRNSMCVLFVHCIDYLWKGLWYIENSQLRSSIYRCVIDVCIATMLVVIKNMLGTIKKKNCVEL